MKKKIMINDLIFEKIKFRYHFMEEHRIVAIDRNIINKLFIDSFYPKYLAMALSQRQIYIRSGRFDRQQKGYAISERVAQDFNTKKLHISELTTMLGYTKTNITKLLQNIKNKNLNIHLVGLGGTGSNFLHWLYEMAEWTNKEHIFKSISSYDDDKFDIPNMLRIPFIPRSSGSEASAYKTKCLPAKFRTLAESWHIYSSRMTIENLNDRIHTQIKSKSFIYGAPDIGTREILSKSEYTFFAATHRDDEYSIVENPTVDNELMMETYGKINLSMFFLNHLSMTIDFLKYLLIRPEPMNIERINIPIIRENFNDKFNYQLNEGFKAGSKKLFAIQAVPRILIDLNLPEEEN